MSNLIVKKKNEVYVTVHSDEEHIHRELADYFTFEVPEAKYLKKNPRYKYWDGTIRLYSPGTGALYHGLTNHLLVQIQTLILVQTTLYLVMVQLGVSMLYCSPDRHLGTNQDVLVGILMVLEHSWIRQKVLTMENGESLMSLMSMYSEEKVQTFIL